MTRTWAPSRLLIRICYRKENAVPTFVSDAVSGQQDFPEVIPAPTPSEGHSPHMTPSQNQSGVNPPARRRSGREGPRELTAAFRRYVERVQSVENPTARDDLDAAWPSPRRSPATAAAPRSTPR